MENEELPRLSASQLAEMGYCERKIVLADMCGARCSPEREQARAYGELQHVTFFIETLDLDAAPRAALGPKERSSVEANGLPRRLNKLYIWLNNIRPRSLSALRKMRFQMGRSVRMFLLRLRDQLCSPRRRQAQKRRQPCLRLVVRPPEEK